jgi:predicted dehydrogenase
MKVLVEKPLFIKYNKFNKFLKYNKNIFVGYNRIYYKNINEIKKIIKKKKTENILINCTEINKKNIISSFRDFTQWNSLVRKGIKKNVYTTYNK